MGTDWYGTELEPDLVQLAFENQAVWFLATKATDGEDGIAYFFNDIEMLEYPSLNRYLAAFLLNQTVLNNGLNLTTEIDCASDVWERHGFLHFAEGWSKRIAGRTGKIQGVRKTRKPVHKKTRPKLDDGSDLRAGAKDLQAEKGT